MCMYVSEICAEAIFVTFPWWLKNVKSRSKIALFSNERHFERLPKKRTITFFWSKLSKLHKKYPILHVATTCSLKQGETRTSHGPIPHPLITQFFNNFSNGHFFEVKTVFILLKISMNKIEIKHLVKLMIRWYINIVYYHCIVTIIEEFYNQNSKKSSLFKLRMTCCINITPFFVPFL